MADTIIEFVKKDTINVDFQQTQGVAGPPGEGTPTGGTTGQVLKKVSDIDFDTNWGSVNKTEIGLGDIDNTSDINKPISILQQEALDLKVDKITGKGLSTEDYTTTEKSKLSGISEGANIGVVPNIAITGAIKTKITYDSKGLVTSGVDATTADISDSTDKRYLSDTQKTEATRSASASQNGLLSSTDWNTFNNKQNSLGYTAENIANKDQISGYAGLDSTGKINPNQLPALAITDTFVVASEIAMLALTAEIGDVAIRTDLNKSFILKTTGASTLANWQELLTPTDSVTSVFGRSGTITVQSGDYTADQITETATRVFISPAQKTVVGNTSNTNTGDETITTIKSKLGITTLSGSNTGDQDLSGLMVKANNLSDLTNTITARTNLGLGSLATQSGTFSGTSSGTNTGDQTSIVGITGTIAQFNTAISDSNIVDTTSNQSIAGNKTLTGLTVIGQSGILQNHKIYIGPAGELLIANTDSDYFKLRNGVTYNDILESGKYFRLGTVSQNWFSLLTWGAERLIIDEYGRIGINQTPNSSYILGINGNTNITGELTWDGSAWTSFSVAMVTVGCSIGSQTCRYKKIGQAIHMLITIGYTTTGSPTALTFSGLPYVDIAGTFAHYGFGDMYDGGHKTVTVFSNATSGQFYFYPIAGGSIVTGSVIIRLTLRLS